MAKILVLGGGFAALAAVEVLSKEVGDRAEITVVSANDEFIFYPALIPMVFGDFEPEELHFNIRQTLLKRGINFVEGKVTKLEPESQEVSVISGNVVEILDFDYLLVAIGRSLSMTEIPGFSEYAHHVLGIASALKFRNAVSDFDSGSIVVGLCPDAFLPVPVCEAALALARKFDRKIADGEISVTAVFPSTLDNAFAGSALFRDLDTEFENKKINLVSDFPIASVHSEAIVSNVGPAINYDLLMLVPPLRGQKHDTNILPFANEEGFVRVNEFMQVDGFDRIYAAGDIIDLPGPKFGYMAVRQGKVAARNIISQIQRKEPSTEYTHNIAWVIAEKYTDPVFFHYGFWDETLADFDESTFFGMAKRIRDRYGPVKSPDI